MSSELLRFGAGDARVTRRDVSYQGFFRLVRLTLEHRLFGGGWSPPFTREVFERGDAVAVLPWDPVRDELVLVEQFRAGAIRGEESPWMLELIAGIVEADEDDEAVAHREAAEEAGCVMDRLESIATFYPSAGACSEQIRLFIGRAVSAGIGEVHGCDHEQEDLLVHAIPRSHALTLVDEDRINNGHTLIALQWLARHGDALRERWLKT